MISLFSYLLQERLNITRAQVRQQWKHKRISSLQMKIWRSLEDDEIYNILSP
jgi:hypothetical protein